MSEEPRPLVKCLVWDLDNTLWQGTLLEDSKVHLTDELRAVVTTLDQRGILQSIASKNEHEEAWQRLETLGIAQYFVHPQIGWCSKAGSVRTIADELSFAHSTIAFIDDQPAERAEVAFHLPEVRCYAAEEARTLVGLPEFSPATVTVDARRRRDMYQAGLRRKTEQASYDGPDEDFLRSLQMEVRISRATDTELSRVEELTLRTSQMNATGVHYPDATLRGLLDSPDHEVLVTTMSDRFGPHGAIGVLLLRRYEKVWQLKLLATSCRVVTYGVGTVILHWLIDQAARAGVHLIADFRATQRNRMMEIAYRFAGFDEQGCRCRAAIAPENDITRLHLLPSYRTPPDTMRLTAPELG